MNIEELKALNTSKLKTHRAEVAKLREEKINQFETLKEKAENSNDIEFRYTCGPQIKNINKEINDLTQELCNIDEILENNL